MVKHIEANPLEDLHWVTYQLICYLVLIVALSLNTVLVGTAVSVVATWGLMTW